MTPFYHASFDVVSRSKQQNAIASAAYAGAKRLQKLDGSWADYTKKQYVRPAKIFVPSHVPRGFKPSVQWIWEEAEKAEKRKNSTVARKGDLALPQKLSLQEYYKIGNDYAQAIADRYGVIVQMNFHKLHKDNPHIDMQWTTRKFDGKQLTDKTRELDDKTTGPQEIVWLREKWAECVNEVLKPHGKSIDHRSYKDQGSDKIPQLHLGRKATALERAGVATEIGDYNRSVRKYNEAIDIIKTQQLEIAHILNDVEDNTVAIYEVNHDSSKQNRGNNAEACEIKWGSDRSTPSAPETRRIFDAADGGSSSAAPRLAVEHSFDDAILQVHEGSNRSTQSSLLLDQPRELAMQSATYGTQILATQRRDGRMETNNTGASDSNAQTNAGAHRVGGDYLARVTGGQGDPTCGYHVSGNASYGEHGATLKTGGTKSGLALQGLIVPDTAQVTHTIKHIVQTAQRCAAWRIVEEMQNTLVAYQLKGGLRLPLYTIPVESMRMSAQQAALRVTLEAVARMQVEKALRSGLHLPPLLSHDLGGIQEVAQHIAAWHTVEGIQNTLVAYQLKNGLSLPLCTVPVESMRMSAQQAALRVTLEALARMQVEKALCSGLHLPPLLIDNLGEIREAAKHCAGQHIITSLHDHATSQAMQHGLYLPDLRCSLRKISTLAQRIASQHTLKALAPRMAKWCKYTEQTLQMLADHYVLECRIGGDTEALQKIMEASQRIPALISTLQLYNILPQNKENSHDEGNTRMHTQHSTNKPTRSPTSRPTGRSQTQFDKDSTSGDGNNTAESPTGSQTQFDEDSTRGGGGNTTESPTQATQELGRTPSNSCR